MQKLSTSALRRRRTALLRQLPPLEAVLRGSLIERYNRCGKPSCCCAQGRSHGPKYYLSTSHPQARPSLAYVAKQHYEQVAQYVANFQLVRQVLEAICHINGELLRRRERL